MSHIADVIVAFACLDEAHVPRIQAHFTANNFAAPILLDDVLKNTRTAPQRTVLFGAYNYLDIGALVAFLESLEWELPDAVQLLVADEHDEPHVYTERLHRNRLKKITEDLTLPFWPEET